MLSFLSWCTCKITVLFLRRKRFIGSSVGAYFFLAHPAYWKLCRCSLVSDLIILVLLQWVHWQTGPRPARQVGAWVQSLRVAVYATSLWARCWQRWDLRWRCTTRGTVTPARPHSYWNHVTCTQEGIARFLSSLILFLNFLNVWLHTPSHVAIGRALDLAIYRSRVQILAGHYCIVDLCKLLTLVCLCRQIKQYNLVPARVWRSLWLWK